MKKLLIILLLFPVFLNLNGQNLLLRTPQGKVLSFSNEGLAIPDTPPDTILFAETMITYYLQNNTHFSTFYTSDVEDYLLTIFDENYIMPDASDNWYTLFKNETDADWFHIFQIDGTTVNRAITKTGDLLLWQLEDEVFEQNNMPPHTYTGDNSGFGIMASSDGWDGVTAFGLPTNNVTGEMSNYKLNNSTNIYLSTNSIDGTAPDIEADNVVNYFLFTNSFDSMSYYYTVPKTSRYVSSTLRLFNPNLSQIIINNNSFSEMDINKVIEQAAFYYSENTPTASFGLNVSGTNASPTCSSFNSNYTRLVDIFADAGQTLSLQITVGGTGTLLQRPRISLPDTIYVTTGDSITIYDDAVCAKSIQEYALNVDYTCAIGERTYYGYNFNESVEGYYQLIVTAKECTTTIEDDTCIVRVINGGNGTGTKTILNIGNSLTHLGEESYVGYIRDSLTGITGVNVGTKGTAPNNHEGNPGWQFSTFLGSQSPFWNGSEIDFNSYRVDSLSLGLPIDIVTIQLGVNDCFSNLADTNTVAGAIIDSAKSLVNHILADGTGVIVIALTPGSENTSDGWYQNYGDANDQDLYTQKVHKLREEINIAFAGKRYANNVYVSFQGMILDRNNGYTKIDNLHNNGVHPGDNGQNQLAQGMVSTIEAYLKGE